MIYVNEKLKYMFEKAPVNYVNDEHTKKSYRVDMMVYSAFNEDEIVSIPNGEWSVTHKDGNMENDALDNLELVVFKNDKFFKSNKELEDKTLSFKKIAREKEDIAKKLDFENAVNKGKVKLLEKQIAYEQGRVREITKELKEKENEIRRLMDILNKRNY